MWKWKWPLVGWRVCFILLALTFGHICQHDLCARCVSAMCCLLMCCWGKAFEGYFLFRSKTWDAERDSQRLSESKVVKVALQKTPELRQTLWVESRRTKGRVVHASTGFLAIIRWLKQSNLIKCSGCVYMGFGYSEDGLLLLCGAKGISICCILISLT